jgi:putative hydrolase of the HAD superfamily
VQVRGHETREQADPDSPATAFPDRRPIRAVVFDIGGVLEIVPPTGWIERWEADLGLAAGELQTRTADLWEAGSEAEVRAGVAERLRLDQASTDALFEDIWAEYLGTLNEPMADYVRSLRPTYRTAIVTNSFVGARERERERYTMEDLVDVIVYSHEVGISKPDPRIYLLACESLGVRPEESIYVDDLEEMVEAAEHVGMLGVVFRGTAQAIEEIDSLLAASARIHPGPPPIAPENRAEERNQNGTKRNQGSQ